MITKSSQASPKLAINNLLQKDNELDDFLITEQQAQQEILKEEALSFDDVAFDNVVGVVGDETINHRAKLNLLNVMNNKKVDQKVELPNEENNIVQENHTPEHNTISRQPRVQSSDEKGPIMKYLSISLVKDSKSTSNMSKLVETRSSFCHNKAKDLLQANTPYSIKAIPKPMSASKVSKYILKPNPGTTVNPSNKTPTSVIDYKHLQSSFILYI